MSGVRFARYALTCLIGASLVWTDTTYTQCGGTLKGEARGVITTPNFPNPYPVPINCRWVIEAPEDKVIAVYFTQFYMREGLQASEYAYFSDSLFMDKTDYGQISSDAEPTYLVTSKPVLVLEFSIMDVGNIHTRVREFFLNVFGFNVTYEVLGKNESVRKDGCIPHRCTFTGNCYASLDFREYFCSCFPSFTGKECQYNYRCGPSGNNDMCNNGGTCRYYIGSEVMTCECPAGYEGSHCEKEIRAVVQSTECLRLGCSQTCSRGRSNSTECACHSGFKLNDDKRTCIHTGRTRFLVSFRLLDWNVDPNRLGDNRTKQLKKGIEKALLALFIPRLHHVENLTVLDFHDAAVVQFHLFGNMDDSEKARQAMEEALRRGKVGNYSVDRSYIRFEWEPGLSIQGLEASELMPAVEGSQLSLNCIVQGSSDMKITWFKDGAPIDINTTYRRIWTNRIPKSSKKLTTAVLDFDTTTVLDSGIFTCEVNDWGLLQNRSIEVVISSVPKPLLTPMTATIREGDGLIITCLSQDDVYGNFGYNWLKNGHILNPLSEPEMIEDLFPAGSRILLKSAVTSSIYTCIITSSAGATRKDAVVTVINKGRKIITCPAEEYLNVKWVETASNADDIQHCPSGFRGDVKRQCLLRQKDVAMWEEPDFSGCLSGEFLAISKNFESLKMGYLFTSVRKILEDLKTYLHNKKDRLHVSEGVPVVDLLDSIQEYEHRNIDAEETIRNNSQAFLDVVSFLLTIPHLIQKQTHLIKLHHLLLSYGLLHGSLAETETFETFERSTLVMEVGKIQRDNKMQLVFPKKETLLSGPAWLTDSLELDIGAWLVDYVEGNNSLSVAVVFYKNLSAFLPKLFLSQQETEGLDLEYHLHSRLVGVAIEGKHPITTSPKNGLSVKARLSHLNQSFGEGVMWNISCGVANFSHGKIEFSVEGCEPVSSGNYTLCQCAQLGTYAVLLTTFLPNGDQMDGMGFEIIAGLGCVICALLICLTLAILIIFWRQIQGAITALKIQICIALLGAYGTMLKALHESLTKEYFPHVISIIQFFLLAAFCMQLCMGLTVYIEFVDMRNVRYPELKIAAMGWAFPLIVVGATLAAQVLEGFRLQSWWLKFETNYFYAYVTSVFIVSLLQVLLFLTVKAELRRHEKAESHHRRRARNRASLLHRSLVLLVILLFVSVSSILYINFDDDIFKYIFAFSSALLGLVVFLSYTLLSENINRMCFTCSNEDPDVDDYENKFRRSNSYKCESFLKPEIVGDTEYCSDAFPTSETLEQRHEQLRRIRSQIDKTSSNHRDWKDLDHALLMPSADKFDPAASDSDGSHHADVTRGVSNFSHHLQGGGHEHAWHCPHSRTGSFPPLELRQLEGSPRSSHLYLVEPPVTTASASPYDLSPTADSVSLRGGYPGGHSSGCQLHRGHSDASESESSQSSSTDDSALVPGGAARAFVPYRPSSGLQFERAPISEEDETDYDGDKAEALQRLFPSDAARAGTNPRTKRDKSLDETVAINPSFHRERGLLRVSESCSTEGDSSEIELPTSHDEDGATGTSKKSWSITTV